MQIFPEIFRRYPACELGDSCLMALALLTYQCRIVDPQQSNTALLREVI